MLTIKLLRMAPHNRTLSKSSSLSYMVISMIGCPPVSDRSMILLLLRRRLRNCFDAATIMRESRAPAKRWPGVEPLR